MFLDLTSKSLDAEFEGQFPLGGNFTKKTVKGRAYWYYSSPMVAGKRSMTYVGPAEDPEITKRVERFNSLKDNYLQRRDMVRSLVAAGLPSPTTKMGDLVEALANAGIFRLRSVLVGSMAYQTYAGCLGVKFPEAQLMTADIDVAQFHSISVAIEDEIPPVLEILGKIDGSFRGVMHIQNQAHPTRFRNDDGIDVEFLTPNTGSDKHQGKATSMPALGGASAEPLRYLDYLIHKPLRSVLLHKAGVSVTVPAPERYAIHKIIVSVSRADHPGNLSKSMKI